MKKNSGIYGLLIVLLFVAGYLSLAGTVGCATIVPPSGGPRDSLPPVLLYSTPPDSTRNFKEKTVTFYFDEYVDVKDVQKNLIVSPLTPSFPTVTGKLKTVTLKFRDTLEENTTYTVNFGDAIKDYTEGNPYSDFTYIFTTGDYFDSLKIRGRVLMALDSKPDSTLTVMLHTSGEDSALAKGNPRYISRLDRNGYFEFDHLPPDTFYISAMKDESGGHRYYGGKTVFGFRNEPFITGQDNDSVLIYAYAPPDEKPLAAQTFVGAPMKANEAKRIRYSTNLEGDRQDLRDTLKLFFEYPLSIFNRDQLSLSTDSTFTPVSTVDISLDSSQRKLTVSTPWTPNRPYHLVMPVDFATDSLGQKLLKADTLNFITRPESDYGTLRLTFTNVDTSQHPVVLFYQNGNLIKSAALEMNSYYSPLFLPGDYELRILLDENQNGVWDPGDFYKGKKQPERVIPVQQSIKVRADWGNEFTINL